MALADVLPFELDLQEALALSALVAFLGTFVAMPRIMLKLRGAGIIGRDVNKPGRPEVPEMGGVGIFLGFYTGVFAFLIVYPLPLDEQAVVLVSLITAAGAAMTGVLDDLIELRQRFKAFIPVVFAAPLAVYAPDYTIGIPLVGSVDFGLLYPLLLVPLGVTCASNGFNMLEGYNGLGTGVGIVTATALTVLVVLEGQYQGLILTLPLIGSLLAFLYYNRYPAKVFPGDTMTLLTGAVLAAAAILGKVEFWGALLFIPHVLEFFLKARGSFEAENFAKRLVPNGNRPPILEYEGRTESLTHIVLKRWRMTEPGVSATFWVLQTALAGAVLLLYWFTSR